MEHQMQRGGGTQSMELTTGTVFTDGFSVSSCRCQAIACVVHLGPSPLHGHYRALLRQSEGWFFADDGVRPKLCNLTDMHARNVYLIWLDRVGHA